MTALMSLGQFTFGLATLAPESVGRDTGWRWAENQRVGARPAAQFLGPAVDGVSLQGVLLPELIGDRDALEELRQMGDAGEAYPLLDGQGRMLGLFAIEKVREQASILFPDGSPQKVDFTLDLRRTDDPGDAVVAATGGEDDDGYFFDDQFNDAADAADAGGG